MTWRTSGWANFTAAGVTTTSGYRGSLATTPKYWTGYELIMEDSANAVMADPGPLYAGRAFNLSWLRGS